MQFNFEKFEFRLLNHDDFQEIVALRRQSFAEKFGESVDLNILNWNDADDRSVHLGMIDKSKNIIASYLRLTFYKAAPNLALSTRMTIPNQLGFPAALLSRAATHIDYKNQQLHQVLRCRALEISLQAQIHIVVGTLEISSKRLNELQRLGYRILLKQEKWNEGFIQANSDVVLIALEGDAAVKSAIAILIHDLGMPTLPKLPIVPILL